MSDLELQHWSWRPRFCSVAGRQMRVQRMVQIGRHLSVVPHLESYFSFSSTVSVKMIINIMREAQGEERQDRRKVKELCTTTLGNRLTVALHFRHFLELGQVPLYPPDGSTSCVGRRVRRGGIGGRCRSCAQSRWART